MCSAALEEYCGSVFWNASFLDREDPDLPICVEQTVLVWIPLGFLWLFAPPHLMSLCRRTRVNTKHWTKLYLCKQFVVALLLLTAIAGLAVTLGEDFGPNSSTVKNAAVYYANPVLFAVTWILVLLCQEGVRRREGAVDSASLFIFWLLLVLCDVFPFQTLIRDALKVGEVSDVPRFCLFHISFGLELIALVLSAFADIPPEAREQVKKNPEVGASFLSRITFSWFNSMVVTGYKRPLVQADMWELNELLSASCISKCFQQHTDTELAAARVRFQHKLRKNKGRSQTEASEKGISNCLKKGVSQDVLMMEDKGRAKERKLKKKKEKEDYPNSWLLPTIYKTFKWTLFESALFRLLQDLLAFVSPQLLKLMISFTQDPNSYIWEGYMYAVLLLLVAILQSVFLQQYVQRCFVLGMKVRAALMAAVYKKALVVSNDTRKESTVGETVNLMSADAQRFNDVTNFIHLLWSCPLQIIVSMVFLWLELGPSVLAGLLVMLLMVPINGLLATKAKKFQLKNMKFKDKRLKIMNEILNGIKILKLFAWEPSFQSQVESIRGEELKVMKKFAYVSSVSIFIFTSAPALVSLASFAVYVLVSPDNVLTAEKAFTSISLFNILRIPLAMLPMLIASIVQTGVSKKRLEKFLGGEDLEADLVRHDPSFDSAVSVHESSFSWEKDTEPLLKDVSLEIKPGRLVAVVGAVGSGKSSLLSALLGEMHCTKGFINIKTRILVTHGVSFLPYVDEVVVLVDGKISEIGSYSSLRASKGAFSEFLDTYAKEQNDQSNSNKDGCQDTEDFEIIPDGGDAEPDSPLEDTVSLTLKRENSIRRSQNSSSVRVRKNSSLNKSEGAGKTKTGQRLIDEEAMEKGQVKFSVYLEYMQAMGWRYTVLVFLVYLIQNTAIIGQNLWLSDWTNDATDYHNQTYPNWKRDTRVGVFGALGVAQGFFVFLGTLLLANASVSASRTLHSRLLNNILRAPMVFFDTTPIGRVVNRFAKDIFTIDEAIPHSFRSWLLSLLAVLGTLFVISLAIPFFTIVIIPLAVIYFFVQRFYVATSRQLHRLDSVSRSPIYSHFGETVSGLSVIRAYKHQDRFLKLNEIAIDNNLKSVYPRIISNRWLAIRLEFLGNLVVFFSALFAVISKDSIESGLVGLAISYALNITRNLNLLVRLSSELESSIVAVERITEYTQIENEAEWITDHRPPEKWPEEGRLQFINYKVRYRPGLDLVLHGITCDIASSEKIGIVGRTGAGKSSLTNCLFRIIEAADGRILIDDVDISTIGLHDLRNRLTIIPQDPVLFSGTLRMNLDPFDKFSDEELWKALELSHLKDYVAGLQEGLQHEVAEGGENLSVGQRQLLCLARALLRKSRILILDEATAAVDLETDDLIQNTIRKEFAHCTVLTIAHRLHSIMDSSRVMVLDAGKIVEFDSPSNLLGNQGWFYAMAKDAGLTQECTAL
ncbi:canalicular multispecific organic anion transporter 1 isoform X2 [Oryzias melastigma]|uniref:canalicular multispecific organic anion transporter 1 isoform X2 n=1 Tax=Oryzias melastigma TaxID=30732 RepID=UPI000CF7B7A2|nr:canalicular multispecific organic anion transporter 1 isoform X2 [Oryzias melastigma]